MVSKEGVGGGSKGARCRISYRNSRTQGRKERFSFLKEKSRVHLMSWGQDKELWGESQKRQPNKRNLLKREKVEVNGHRDGLVGEVLDGWETSTEKPLRGT